MKNRHRASQPILFWSAILDDLGHLRPVPVASDSRPPIRSDVPPATENVRRPPPLLQGRGCPGRHLRGGQARALLPPFLTSSVQLRGNSPLPPRAPLREPEPKSPPLTPLLLPPVRRMHRTSPPCRTRRRPRTCSCAAGPVPRRSSSRRCSPRCSSSTRSRCPGRLSSKCSSLSSARRPCCTSTAVPLWLGRRAALRAMLLTLFGTTRFLATLEKTSTKGQASGDALLLLLVFLIIS
jgi:hypothetical protein